MSFGSMPLNGRVAISSQQCRIMSWVCRSYILTGVFQDSNVDGQHHVVHQPVPWFYRFAKKEHVASYSILPQNPMLPKIIEGRLPFPCCKSGRRAVKNRSWPLNEDHALEK